MDGAAFLQVADVLVTGETEAEWRSGVSRAYYAAFHVARKLLEDCGFRLPGTHQSHTYISLRLSNCSFPELIEAGRALADLRSKRNWADYDLVHTLDQTTAQDEVIVGGKIVDVLQLADNEPGIRAKIAEAMKAYERDVLRQVTWKP